jgi:hypothetical protein
MTFCDKDGKLYKQDAHKIPIPEKYAGLEPFRYERPSASLIW